MFEITLVSKLYEQNCHSQYSNQPKPVLNVITQTPNERGYVISAYEPNQLAEVRQRWVTGAHNDCWVSVGDIVARLDQAKGKHSFSTIS